MTLSAAPARLDSIPVPDGLYQQLEIARYRAWLEEAYRTAISSSVRELIAEVSTELAEVSANSHALVDEFGTAILGAVQSVASAIDCELPSHN